jgi:hypothetical protein
MVQVLTKTKVVASVVAVVVASFLMATVPAHAESTPAGKSTDMPVAEKPAPAPDVKGTAASPSGQAPAGPASSPGAASSTSTSSSSSSNGSGSTAREAASPTGKMARKGKRRGKRARKLARARGKKRLAKRARNKRRVRTAQAVTGAGSSTATRQ